MTNGVLKNCFTCCRTSNPDVFTEEAPSLKNCLGKFFGSPWVIGASSFGVLGSMAFCAAGEVANLVNATGIPGEIGRYTAPWIAAVVAGGASVVVLTGSVICHCCPTSQRTQDSGYLPDTTYRVGNTQDSREAACEESSDAIRILEFSDRSESESN